MCCDFDAFRRAAPVPDAFLSLLLLAAQRVPLAAGSHVLAFTRSQTISCSRAKKSRQRQSAAPRLFLHKFHLRARPGLKGHLRPYRRTASEARSGKTTSASGSPRQVRTGLVPLALLFFFVSSAHRLLLASFVFFFPTSSLLPVPRSAQPTTQRHGSSADKEAACSQQLPIRRQISRYTLPNYDNAFARAQTRSQFQALAADLLPQLDSPTPTPPPTGRPATASPPPSLALVGFGRHSSGRSSLARLRRPLRLGRSAFDTVYPYLSVPKSHPTRLSSPNPFPGFAGCASPPSDRAPPYYQHVITAPLALRLLTG